MTDVDALSTTGEAPPAAATRGVSSHLEALGEAARDYARNARAENTRRVYETDWRQFSSWRGSRAGPRGNLVHKAAQRRLGIASVE